MVHLTPVNRNYRFSVIPGKFIIIFGEEFRKTQG